ncbi:hypothetical protein ACIRP2_30730 [Streptomyces sp. NPDC101194]
MEVAATEQAVHVADSGGVSRSVFAVGPKGRRRFVRYAAEA